MEQYHLYIYFGVLFSSLVGMFIYFKWQLNHLKDEVVYYRMRYSFEQMLDHWVERQLDSFEIMRNTDKVLEQQSKNFKYPGNVERLTKTLKQRLIERDLVGGGYSGDPYHYPSHNRDSSRPQPSHSLGETETQIHIR